MGIPSKQSSTMYVYQKWKIITSAWWKKRRRRRWWLVGRILEHSLKVTVIEIETDNRSFIPGAEMELMDEMEVLLWPCSLSLSFTNHHQPTTIVTTTTSDIGCHHRQCAVYQIYHLLLRPPRVSIGVREGCEMWFVWTVTKLEWWEVDGAGLMKTISLLWLESIITIRK